VHLGLRAPERLRHASVVLEGLDDRAVVAGDLNEEAGAAAYDLIAGRLPRASDGVPTFPARLPAVALDAVFAGRGLGLVRGPEVRVAEADLRAGSDHRPVWADFDLRPRAS
jgi:endonuclease/exonuclease/phosphatase family metal-dependent hydrolase